MAFWKKIYKSKYTGAEIDAAVAKAGDATKVTANPTLAGTESALTGLEVGTTKYKVNQPINVVANPTLAGTEDTLIGLQIGDTKYKAGGGGNCEYISYTMSGGSATINETYANILSLIQSGKAVYLYPTLTDGVASSAPMFRAHYYNTTSNEIDFIGESHDVDYDNNKLIIVTIYLTLANDDTTSVSMDTLTISATIS